ncbi:MAG TPA: hypothetical protein VIG47_12950, partial [Gemmatimonadaceae bacterium]
MTFRPRVGKYLVSGIAVVGVATVAGLLISGVHARASHPTAPDGNVSVHRAVAFDVSQPLGAALVGAAVTSEVRQSSLPPNALAPDPDAAEQRADTVIPPPVIVVPRGSAQIEQRTAGTRRAAVIAASFTGLGADFVGPQGNAAMRNPSDNSLAVGPNHVMQIVNSRMAIFTKRGHEFDTTGRPLYGPVETNNVFKGFGGACEAHNNGDAVARYDQLANRWLIVMPIFTRLPRREHEPVAPRAGEPASVSQAGRPGQPGAAVELNQPPHAEPTQLPGEGPPHRPSGPRPQADSGSYGMC